MAKLFFTSVIAVVLVSLSGSVSGKDKDKEKEKETAKSESAPFEMTGTVTKYTVGICMMRGIDYDLHPKKGEAVHLSDGPRGALKVLGDAVKSGGSVHVTGTWMTA